MSDGYIVAAEAAVVTKLVQDGWREVKENHTPQSYFFVRDGTPLFLPRAPNGLGYTQEQLSQIEHVFHCYGIDLLPLDHTVH